MANWDAQLSLWGRIEDLCDGLWKEMGGYLLLPEFACDNSYLMSIQMDLFETLYWGQCRSQISWFEVGEAKLVRPDLLQDALDKEKLMRERLLIAQSRQESNANNWRRELEFSIGEWVLFASFFDDKSYEVGKKDKLRLRLIEPFEVLERVENASYKLVLPTS